MVDQLVRPESMSTDVLVAAFGYDKDSDAWKSRVKEITHPRNRAALAALEKLQAEAYQLDLEAASYLAREACRRILPGIDAM